MTLQFNPFLCRPTSPDAVSLATAAVTAATAAGAQDPKAEAANLLLEAAADLAPGQTSTVSEVHLNAATGNVALQPGESVNLGTGEISGVVEQTDDVPAAAIEEPGVPMSIVTGHSNGQFSKILTGLCGTKSQATEGESATFTPDPVYKQVAYLFSLMEGGSFPIPGMPKLDEFHSGTTFADIKVPTQEHIKAMTMNMLQGQGARWERLYDMVSSGAGALGDIGRTMIDNERANTKAGIQRAIEQSGLQVYGVPITWSAMTYDGAAQVARVDGRTLASQVVDKASVVGGSIELAEGVPAQLLADTQSEIAEFTDEQMNHDGSFDFDLEGSLKVLAASPEQAAELAPVMMKLGMQFFPELVDVQPQRIAQVTLQEREPDYERDHGY